MLLTLDVSYGPRLVSRVFARPDVNDMTASGRKGLRVSCDG